jgi:hypothetical protein
MADHKTISVYLEPSLYERIKKAAQAENRTMSNYIAQCLNVSLDDPMLRQKMNPALTAGLRGLTQSQLGIGGPVGELTPEMRQVMKDNSAQLDQLFGE